MGVGSLTRRELSQALREPDCFERWSSVGGQPYLVVDLDSESAADDSTALQERLQLLPAVTIGVGGRGGATAERVDVRLAEMAEVASVAEAVLARPLASVALVQLLRLGEGLSVEQAVVAESLVYSTLQAGPEFAAWLAGHERRPPSPPSREPAVLARRDGKRLELCLNRPEKRNAFSAAMRDGLCEGLQLVLRDDSVEEVELSGAGVAFSSGGDLDEFGTFPDPATAHGIRTTRSAAILLAACADRVHARVHGACIGAGAELPAFCHRVISHPDAFFALPEVAMGLVPGAGGTASLPRRIGRQRTAWMALTGSRVDAPTALDWGLVDALVELAPN